MHNDHGKSRPVFLLGKVLLEFFRIAEVSDFMTKSCSQLSRPHLLWSLALTVLLFSLTGRASVPHCIVKL
ncbi:hypothetical protein J6590_011871 [Homalodisca vitripennis]|nr:hypothetical protein J6590_011871 [Homalodisca vitripennis]